MAALTLPTRGSPSCVVQPTAIPVSVVARLGVGATAAVSKAITDTPTRRPLAVKKYHEGCTPERRKEERRFTQLGPIPGLVRFLGSVTTGEGGVGLGFQLISGSTLERLPKPIRPREVAFYILQISETLRSIHAKGIVHADVKPDNVLINQAGDTYLCDLGSSQDLTGTETRGCRNFFLGTVGYQAPELLFQAPFRSDIDLFSLGLITYELLMGEPLVELRLFSSASEERAYLIEQYVHHFGTPPQSFRDRAALKEDVKVREEIGCTPTWKEKVQAKHLDWVPLLESLLSYEARTLDPLSLLAKTL